MTPRMIRRNKVVGEDIDGEDAAAAAAAAVVVVGVVDTDGDVVVVLPYGQSPSTSRYNTSRPSSSPRCCLVVPPCCYE